MGEQVSTSASTPEEVDRQLLEAVDLYLSYFRGQGQATPTPLACVGTVTAAVRSHRRPSEPLLMVARLFRDLRLRSTQSVMLYCCEAGWVLDTL